MVDDADPARVDMRGLEQPALAGSAVGEIGADLVGRDPGAPGIDLRIFQRAALALLLPARRLGAFDKEPAVLETDDSEFGAPAVRRPVGVAPADPAAMYFSPATVFTDSGGWCGLNAAPKMSQE